jgi:hypothetical protein
MRHVLLCGMALLLFATGRLKDIEPKQAVVVYLMIQDSPVLLTAIVQPPEEK